MAGIESGGGGCRGRSFISAGGQVDGGWRVAQGCAVLGWLGPERQV